MPQSGERPFWNESSRPVTLPSVRIAIIDYQAGNLTSVQRALAHLGVAAEVTPDPQRVVAADRVIFPGVGAAAACMANLQSGGLDQALREVIAAGKPVLGICVGMQLLFEHSDEDGGSSAATAMASIRNSRRINVLQLDEVDNTGPEYMYHDWQPQDADHAFVSDGRAAFPILALTQTYTRPMVVVEA